MTTEFAGGVPRPQPNPKEAAMSAAVGDRVTHAASGRTGTVVEYRPSPRSRFGQFEAVKVEWDQTYPGERLRWVPIGVLQPLGASRVR